MGIKRYFYDSYAVIEYLKDNSRYTEYFEKHKGIITLLNLLEVYYGVLKEENEIKANHILDKLYSLIKEPQKKTIQEAMKFKLKMKRKKLSYVDCLGYAFAKEQGIKFLTGDKEFEGLQNTEFVK